MPSDGGGPDPLAQALATQRSAFARGAPDYRARIAALDALRDGLHAHEAELVQAVSDDYGGRAREETLLLELFPLYEAIRHARRHLKRWMRRRRVRGAWALKPGRAFVMYQPLGVVGVVGAWNYQLLLTLGPVVDAIAAGNHVILKPSEVTPRSAALIARIVGERFAPEYLTVITGGPETAAAFSALPFDHLVFTGSTRLGKIVMKAAAENLVPVTLELGGKSPAIVGEGFSLQQAAQKIMFGKCFNSGQSCVAPDYTIVAKGKVDAFVEECRVAVGRMYPQLGSNPDYTTIISDAHYERLQMYVKDARDRGAKILELNPAKEELDPNSRKMAPTIILHPKDEMLVMQEEIFGPIMPVFTYETIEDAIGYVNEHPRPLALYYFDNNQRRIDRVLRETVSGGVTINDVMLHVAQSDLPFGGAGASGVGSYHGREGFEAFTKKKPVFYQSRLAATGLLRPPYKERVDWLLKTLLGK